MCSSILPSSSRAIFQANFLNKFHHYTQLRGFFNLIPQVNHVPFIKAQLATTEIPVTGARQGKAQYEQQLPLVQ